MDSGNQTKWMLVWLMARAALLAASAHADPPQLIFPEVSPPAQQAGGKPKRVAVSGKVMFPDGKPAEGIYVYAVGCNRKGDRTRTSARTDAAGTYRLSVRSEQVYVVLVVNPEWSAPFREWLVVESEAIENIDFQLVRGILLNVAANEGDEKQPLDRIPIYLAGALSCSAAEAKQHAGYRFCVLEYLPKETDAAGQCTFCVAPGTYTLHLNQFLQREIVVDAPGPMDQTFHVPTGDTKTLTGKVIDLQKQPIAGATVKGVYAHGPYRFDQSAVTDADGNFHLERERLPLMLATESLDGKLRGVSFVEGNVRTTKIWLRPTLSVRGRLMDAIGRPLTGGTLECGLVVRLGHGYKLLLPSQAKPDADGNYKLEGLVDARYEQLQLNYWPAGEVKRDPQRLIVDGDEQPFVPVRNFRSMSDSTTELGDSWVKYKAPDRSPP